ncbi:MAG: glycoside hydrolase family 127 protein [Clostridia bacterium]|nr:glycoside hydrolase family 127 protein [Clostridia bacterium]
MLKFNGVADRAARFLQKEQLSDPVLWAKFVDVFRTQPDAVNQGWRGEYWGKMMRAASLVYGYTRDPELYAILSDSVRDMMTVAENDGRVSTYPREAEFDSWDIWCRKYVMLAGEYFMEVCEDEQLKTDLLRFICGCADYIIAHIGADKKKITSASRSWFGINSSSVLEPIVRLYKLTGEKRYLDFAAYIVDEGGASNVNIFERAFENKLFPYQYGVSKAYELTSCFEGLLEYALVTNNERWLTAVMNYGSAILDSEISVIGSCGITHELFDHTRTRQTVRQDDVMQETCVTVTWMNFCSRLLKLTGDSRYADAMEKAFYNAYLGAINFGHKECIRLKAPIEKKEIVPTYLAFDSYSPLIPGTRGMKVGGYQILPDKSYYGCCACIGSAGVGIFLKNAVTLDKDGIVINFFESGSAKLNFRGTDVEISMETAYPADGHVKLHVKTAAPTAFTLKVRNPGWSDLPNGYSIYNKTWCDDTLEIDLSMPIRLHYPEHWEEDLVYTDTFVDADGNLNAAPKTVFHRPEEDNYVAVTRGPLTLAADSRTGKPAGSVFSVPNTAVPGVNEITDGVPCMVRMEFTAPDGERFSLVDYASAGLDWETEIAAWLPTK